MPRKDSPLDVQPRHAPDLADDLVPLVDPQELVAGGASGISERSIEGLILESLPQTVLRFESCVLTRVSFAGSTLRGLRFKDVRLVSCSLANVEARGLSMSRVEMVNCRLTGLRAVEAECHDLLAADCEARYAQFSSAVFKASELTACNFTEADFQGADLRRCRVGACNLQGVELSGGRLAGADLRGSNLAGMRVRPEDVRGATVDAAQAMVLAGIFGLRIA
jgi:uncharacterized protein YjbI with pentapeptide repeats